MPLTNTQLFLRIKEVLRAHEDWDDEQIVKYLDLRQREKDLIRVARRDLAAG